MQMEEQYINDKVAKGEMTREHADELIAILYGEERTTHHEVNVFCNTKTNEWMLDDITNHNINNKYTIFHKYKLPRPAFNKEDVENMLDKILAKEEQ